MSDTDSSFDEDDEITTLGETKCFVCPVQLASPGSMFTHLLAVHDLDITAVYRAACPDFYSWIRLVNFLRSHNGQPTTNGLIAMTTEWDTEHYLIPALPDDPALRIQPEEYFQRFVYSSGDCSTVAASSSQSVCDPDNAPDPGTVASPDAVAPHETMDQHSAGHVNLTKKQYNDLIHRLHVAEKKSQKVEIDMESALKDMDTMRSVAKEMMSVSIDPRCPRSVACIQPDEDEHYFGSYAHYSMHEEMLKDKVRTETYKNFIYSNPHLFKDKIVLDLGCGTGILSMFAARAGARRVFAVDQSDIIYHTIDIVRENGFDDVITVVHGRIEDIDLGVDRVDTIISEWMGYFLQFESMLDSVLFARDKWTCPPAMVYPDRCTVSLVAISDMLSHDSAVSFWNDVYGFGMSCMKSCVLEEGCIKIVDPSTIISTPSILTNIVVPEVSADELQYDSEFFLDITRDALCTALVGYFDIFFERQCEKPQSFSTSPTSPKTHWKQTVFLLPNVISLKQGEALCGRLSCKKNVKDLRSIVINIKVRDLNLNYILQ